MTKTANNLIKDWGTKNRSEQRVPVTSRLDFTTYAKLHALKDAFPKRSVNDIINDLLRTGLDSVIEELPEPKAESTEYIEEVGDDVFLQENASYRFYQTYANLMDSGKEVKTEGDKK